MTNNKPQFLRWRKSKNNPSPQSGRTLSPCPCARDGILVSRGMALFIYQATIWKCSFPSSRGFCVRQLKGSAKAAGWGHCLQISPWTHEFRNGEVICSQLVILPKDCHQRLEMESDTFMSLENSCFYTVTDAKQTFSLRVPPILGTQGKLLCLQDYSKLAVSGSGISGGPCAWEQPGGRRFGCCGAAGLGRCCHRQN